MSVIDEYFDAFARRDLPGISELLTEDVTLQDPNVALVSGKEAVLVEYQKIFSSFRSILCELRRRYIFGDEYAVEFSLRLEALSGELVRVDGIDCITLCDGRIKGLRAYLDVNPKN